LEENDLNEKILKEENKREKRSRFVGNIIIVTVAFVIAAVIIFALYTVFFGAKVLSSTVFTPEQLNRLEYAANLIQKNYLYDYDTDKMIDGAIAGMVDSLDNKFTYYEKEEQYQESLTDGNSNYVGIGVHLTYDQDNDCIRVLGTMPNSPAESAGIKAGDLILKVDDIVVSKETYIDGVNAIRGEEGTSVTITIKRGEDLQEYTVNRTSIQENNVTSEIIDGVGYIRIFSFSNGIYDQFKEAYDELKNQNISGLVIDLRNNPGGYVDETLKIADMFVNSADALKLVDKNKNEKVYKTTDGGDLDTKIAVIVNQNSASASEILASIVKDLNRGKVFGVQTYGKGVVQYVLRIKDHGAIDLVSAQYFTPSGVVIQDNGITPDEIVEVEDEYKNNTFIPREKDTQLQSALDYIKNGK